jgi:parallel beta helix pectate lyase-like protein
MKRLLLLTLALVACDGSVTEPAAKPAASLVATTCNPTPFVRDAHPLTAAVLGGTLSNTVIDATGCDIGVYYAPGTAGSISQSTVAGATYFGVLSNGAAVDVTNSAVSNIGDRPFNGSQHGVAILYTTEDVAGAASTGTVSGSTISLYQKGGITVRGPGASASILNNTVNGLGSVEFIAQNGIQVSFGGSGVVRGNSVSGNDYTPAGTTSCGILLFDAAGVKVQDNKYVANETNMCNAGKGGGNVSE